MQFLKNIDLIIYFAIAAFFLAKPVYEIVQGIIFVSICLITKQPIPFF